MNQLQFAESLEIRITQEELQAAVQWVPPDREVHIFREMNGVLCRMAIDGCDRLYETLASRLRLDGLSVKYLLSPQFAHNGFCYNAGDSIIARCSLYPEHVAEVGIRLASDQTTVRLEVEDNGMGINPRVEKCLFARNIRSKKRRKAIFIGGRGTHMHDAKEEIDYRHGKIGYINKGKEQGAIFWYEIPLEAMVVRP